MNKTRLISNEVVRASIKSTDLIALMDQVFIDLSAGAVRALPRNAMFHQNGNILALMASSHPEENVCGCKIAMFPGPAAAAAGTNQSAIVLFDVNGGALKAIVAAEHITLVRTAAATAAATNRLACRDAKTLCLLGAGSQAIAHAEAICAIRDMRRRS